MAITWPAKNNYATGDVLTAANMNGIGDDLNDLYAQTVSGGSAYAAGKNAVINGDFGVWQRGTSISQTTGNQVYTADRFLASCTFSAGTASFSQQTFTAGTAPVVGYEGTYFGRQTCGSTSTSSNLYQRIESVRTFAGQTVTFSFWAKASTALTYTVYGAQVFGSGGSANVDLFGNTINLTTSWQRFTQTITIPSIAGKTIGTNDYLLVGFYYSSGTLNSATIDTWGWQLEAGSTATPFQTATGTKQGELAACQRYFEKSYNQATAPGTNTDAAAFQKVDIASSTTGTAGASVEFKVAKRGTPTITLYSSVSANSGKWVINKAGTQTEYNYTVYSPQENGFVGYCAGAASGLTAYNPYGLIGHWTASAEL